MLRLAVSTQAETYERMQQPLAERDIAVEYIQTAERTVSLSETDLQSGFDVGFVFPPRLAEGGVADALLGIPWVNGREEVLRSRHKGETLARLANAGVAVPETVVVSNPVAESELIKAFERFDGPVVVKPNSATRGIGIAKTSDLDSFLGICDYLDLVHDYRATGDRSFLVQEFLPDARDYRVMLIDGEYVGAVERRLPEVESPSGDTPEREISPAGGTHTGEGRTRQRWKHNVHRGARATPVELPETLRTIAETAATALEIPWLGVDLLVTDSRVVVNETNARPTIDTAEKYEEGFWDALAGLVRRQR